MRIRVAGWSLAVAAAWSGAAGQAQNVSGGASVPFAQTGAPIPFTFTSPLSPAPAPAVPRFTESPVAPYGKLATPITTPAAPIVAARPTTLMPNGVLRSNGAILAPGTSFATVVPSQNFPALGVADLESPFYQDGGQVLFFNGGIRVFVRDGVIQ